jgi:hypothetical protein
MAGFGHGYATLRLIFRRWRAYGEAARKDE